MMQRALHSPICAACRLRTLIRTKEVARSRKTVASVPVSTSSLASSSSKRAYATAATPPRPSSRALVQHTRAFASSRTSASPASGFSQRQEVELVERLYTSGNITRDEWRESVWIQAGLKRDVHGDRVSNAIAEDASIEDKVRRLREWYGAGEVPEQLLEGEEMLVHERLFGGMRQIVVQEDGAGLWGGGEEAEGGVQVLREVDGSLEVMEFDEDGEEEEENVRGRRRVVGNEQLANDIRRAVEGQEQDTAEGAGVEWEGESLEGRAFLKTHPLTLANRFATSPSTLEMPSASFVEPINAMLANLSTVHLSEAAHRVFGGPGLPYSTSTPHRGKLMQQKPIALDAQQGNMAEIEGDVYLSTLMPGVYASVMSVLAETRKRLGTAWAEGLVRKAEAGELRILDAGGAGAGVLAVREMLRAEWERMHEDSRGDESPMALAELDGKAGGAGASPPLGAATVLTGSDVLRKRVSKLLDNTTFVPRLPDYVHTEEAKKKGKFDLVIAPHTLWPLREDYIRKTHVQNLWSLLSTDGGVLVLLEKGVARGFELVAGAREMLLDTRISSPKSLGRQRDIDEPVPVKGSTDIYGTHGEARDTETSALLSTIPKEAAMIIAPCTNHEGCPMYTQKGHLKGRKDICAFEQRYHRPAFLQKVFGAKGRNHEDVEFSYIAVMRGRDMRQANEEEHQPVEQTEEATDRAFAGYGPTQPAAEHRPPHSLSLPRAVLPPLKRKGHVIMDLCTPSGTLERWTVPRSFDKQAFRDARKSSWGDLWALGAKTRISRSPKAKPRLDGEDGEYAGMERRQQKWDRASASGRRERNWEKRERERGLGGSEGFGSNEYGMVTFNGELYGGEKAGGRMREGRRVGGLRDKRDKRGDGNGRRKNRG